MTEIHDITTWFTTEGWKPAHELRPNGTETLCGWWLKPEDRRQASDGMKRCGQCLRRRSR